MNADPFSITSKNSTRPPYIFHPPPRRRGSTVTHAKTIHAPSTGARGSISDHIWIQSTSHPFRIRFGIISHHLCEVHLSEEVNLTLTLNNLNIVSQCTVRSKPGTEFGDMRWIQVAISHDAKSSQLQVDDAACTIRASRVLSELPIQSLHNVYNAEIVRPPVGNAAPIRPDPYTFTFVGNVDTGAKTNDGSIILKPKYDSPIPRFYGCLRGLLVNGELLDMREMAEKLATSEMYDAYGPAQVHTGCDVGCSTISCSNGGHCSVAWTNTDPSADKTTCDCSRTSYSGATCSLDEGIHLAKNAFLEFDVSIEMDRVFDFLDRNNRIPQILKFAFSSPAPIADADTDEDDDGLEEKAVLASVTFREKRKLEIEINPNHTINVAITYENGRADVLNFDGDFLDGYRHFVVVQTNQATATAVMIDSLRQDFEYRDSNIDMFSARTVRIGGRFSETDGDNKIGFEGCVSNFLLDYQRGAALSYSPIVYYANPFHHLNRLITDKDVALGSCADFEVPNSLPVYQNRVKFPIWDTDFKRFIYTDKIETPTDDSDWTSEDSGSLLWIVIIILLLALVFLILFCIFMKCCRERVHARETYIHDEDIPLNLTPTIMRHPQPSPPPQKQSAASNYHIPNPNVDFNKELPYGSDDDDDETLRYGAEGDADDSDQDTIRHIDDEVQDEDGMVIVRTSTDIQVSVTSPNEPVLSRRTIRRRLQVAGLHGRRPVKKPLVSLKNRKARFEWAKQHLSWGPREWANHIWSNESKFNMFGTDGIQWIRRPIGSRYASQYQCPTRIVGTMDRYVFEDILENTMRPWARANLGRSWVFQQDNDPKHTSDHVANWFRRRRVDLLEWPSQSPDLNPIENMWEERERRLKVVRASNAKQKFAQLEAAWKSIPMTVVQTLLDSMPRRCQAVIDAKGCPTNSRPTQVNHLPRRVSSFRSGDPTAPIDSPLYAVPRKPAPPVHATTPVPPPRIMQQ
uniref:Laminin G domain-containing protein n=1 Tax=Caenorhabditis japonica TaxID=281687 RepID=A0A8R1I351_CAEJA